MLLDLTSSIQEDEVQHDEVKEPETNYQCGECGKVFVDLHQIELHISEEHKKCVATEPENNDNDMELKEK